VNADGVPSTATPYGFTSARLATGRYQINFPPGTWFPAGTGLRFPVIAVTPTYPRAYSVANVSSDFVLADGSSRFIIDIVDVHQPNTLVDNSFMFIAVLPQAAP
jgi:hypothetical protein